MAGSTKPMLAPSAIAKNSELEAFLLNMTSSCSQAGAAAFLRPPETLSHACPCFSARPLEAEAHFGGVRPARTAKAVPGEEFVAFKFIFHLQTALQVLHFERVLLVYCVEKLYLSA
ncbi:hypothetical protein [Paucibacter sp. DJ2R-2]|uniref:hypothetical protein n=1 Tax=Paucibacter sp. DJ2R-2 TaxID=2893558 RepID=UPI0021E4A4D6|nr:hypothetical protein [Paucibacter sp. DJ2R-2]MCV2421824.1 hypothetical protein [Paucibacter sp. DJ4R-1]MCV2439559.1 hypothetical protein [Paucibacter sp. DJ2R-2]